MTSSPLDIILISIHAPREGSDRHSAVIGRHDPISIHAPREGSDIVKRDMIVFRYIFQSTLPVRGATLSDMQVIKTARFQSTLPVRGATLR